MPPDTRPLEQILRRPKVESAERQLRQQIIADTVLSTSPYLKTPNFDAVHDDDIQLLYELYDENFFHGQLQKCLTGQSISFRLSRRMLKAGGRTTRWGDRRNRKPARYEIAVSSSLLFQSFRNPERHITVTGLDCESRLDALLRIMEHELVHLAELLVWTDSNCSMFRFQGIASGMFGHTDHRHDLITHQETAQREFGVRPGVRVRFDFEGHSMQGIVNRVTKRATVLVMHSEGQLYSDGQRYLKFYLPVSQLEILED
ncbi:MAG: hypothetical protein R3C49_22795 [Planctomycetaceae bacterium]